jgi:hypothetical protein
MHNRRNLAWKLNWYRQSELEGALLLGKMVRHVSDPFLVSRLTRHCADEARHAWLWERTRAGLGLETIRIDRSYQSFYLDAAAPPRSLPEVLGLTHLRTRVHRQFSEEVEDPSAGGRAPCAQRADSRRSRAPRVGWPVACGSPWRRRDHRTVSSD